MPPTHRIYLPRSFALSSDSRNLITNMFSSISSPDAPAFPLSTMNSRISRLLSRVPRACTVGRTYATAPHKPTLKLNTTRTSPGPKVTSGSLLSQALDQRNSGRGNGGSVGPFALGGSLRDDVAPKPWAQLSTGGKVKRGAMRTSNLTVILVGAGLFAVLSYSLSTELFSKNSPTVLYGQACDKIRDSEAVAKHLHGSLSFHNNAPSSGRPRHRARHVVSQIAVDSTGREHMLLHFYVNSSSSALPTAESEDESYWESVTSWGKDRCETLSELSVDDVKGWGEGVLQSGKNLVRYLSGESTGTGTSADAEFVRLQKEKKEKEREARIKRIEDERKSGWSFAGMFSSLRGAKTGGDVVSFSGRAWTEGEVSADLVRNDEGNFVWRSLVVDVPSSRSRHARIHVERGSDVRDNEPVMRWN